VEVERSKAGEMKETGQGQGKKHSGREELSRRGRRREAEWKVGWK
jgi:hypothetical protein